MRIRKSTRPPGFPSADWNRLNAKQKAKVIADYHASLAPDVAAVVADPDADFHAIGNLIREFEESMDSPFGFSPVGGSASSTSVVAAKTTSSHFVSGRGLADLSEELVGTAAMRCADRIQAHRLKCPLETFGISVA